MEEHRGRFGVEPICSTLGVSASAYYQRDGPAVRSRGSEDERLLGASVRRTRRTSRPTAIAAPGRRCSEPASRSLAARCSA